jgi:hypothetical protein
VAETTISTPDGPQKVRDVKDGVVIIRTSDHGGTYLRRVLDKAQEWDREFPIEPQDWHFADIISRYAANDYAQAHDTAPDVWYTRLLTDALKVMSSKLPDGYKVEDGRYGVEILEDSEDEPEDATTTPPTSYGPNYDVLSCAKARDGRWIVLAHAPHKHHDRYATGVVPGQVGGYFATPEAARLSFVERIAEDYDLVVGPPHSIFVRPGDRNRLTNDAQGLKDRVADWRNADDLRATGDELAADADELAQSLQKLGILQRDVYTASELPG